MIRIITGEFKNRLIVTPKGGQTRPTTSQVRGALFNICQLTIGQARFLDLYAGSGAMGLEALSRGAKTATFVENDKEAIRCIRQNLNTFHIENRALVYPGEVFPFLEKEKKNGKQYDIIYADPPYGQGETEKLLTLIDHSSLLAQEGFLFIEESTSLAEDLPLTTLAWDSTRRYGKTFLQTYRRKET
jgi:16S rRNA (guanine966-N2)-methyltransferase